MVATLLGISGKLDRVKISFVLFFSFRENTSSFVRVALRLPKSKALELKTYFSGNQDPRKG